MYSIYVLLSNENQFTFKRTVLLGSLIASLLFPLITIPAGGLQLIPSLSQSAASYLLPEITIYADATQVTAKAQGESTAFDAVYAQYKLAPEVTRRRMYYETMEKVLAKTDKTIVEPRNVVPYLPAPSAAPAKQPEPAK